MGNNFAGMDICYQYPSPNGQMTYGPKHIVGASQVPAASLIGACLRAHGVSIIGNRQGCKASSPAPGRQVPSGPGPSEQPLPLSLSLSQTTTSAYIYIQHAKKQTKTSAASRYPTRKPSTPSILQQTSHRRVHWCSARTTPAAWRAGPGHGGSCSPAL